ncbi:hypothetical protein [Spartinivicinus ruber]|uniref:hypothetical protein n=1 Tax=Spartinivicinus ruber TaxID=2683272 RepID=UPI0013D53619|nr:hypothetical protein [Spartinivicinus ruber]
MIKRWSFFLLIVSLSSFSLIAGDKKTKSDNIPLAVVAEKIRSGEIDVGKEYSLNTKTGRFHIIHADKMLMDCSSCHYGYSYKNDFLIMVKYKPYPALAKGQYERSVCLGCHQQGGIATQWYHGSTNP